MTKLSVSKRAKLYLSIGASALVMSSLMTGCGGGSSSSSASSPQNVTIKAIDGYLVSAQVYQDKNADNIAQTNEWIGETDENGEVSVNDGDLSYPTIVKVIAGKTWDVDSAGYATHNYEMMAAANATIVNPFTTLAITQHLSQSEISAALSLPESLLFSDYTQSTEVDALQTQLLARSAVNELRATIIETGQDDNLVDNVFQLQAKVTKIPTNELAGSILILENNDVNQYAVTPSMSTYFDKTYWEYSLVDQDRLGCITVDSNGNPVDDEHMVQDGNKIECRRNQGDDVVQVTFDYHSQDDATLVYQDFGDFMTPTQFDMKFINGSTYYVTYPKETDVCEDDEYDKNTCRGDNEWQVVYASDEFGLYFSDIDKDIGIDTQHDMLASGQTDYDLNSFPLKPITDIATFESQTFYQVQDSIQCNETCTAYALPSPTLDKITIVKVTNADKGIITIGSQQYKILEANHDMYVIKDIVSNHPSLLIKNKDLADYLYDVWSKSLADN